MSLFLILASKSPRRKELLAQIGYQFELASADIDESVIAEESPAHYVERLAIAKASVIADKHCDVVVLGSDTAVVVDQHILGKPENEQDFRRMMQLLSGRSHQVMTSIATIVKQNGKTSCVSKVVTTDVSFKSLSNEDIANYWHTGEPQDKAGGYGIQGVGGQLITDIKGSYSAVVGLPLYETAEMLKPYSLTGRLI